MATPAPASPARSVTAVCAGLLAITLAVHWPVLDSAFVNFDDDVYVTGNPRVRAGLSLEGARSAFSLERQGAEFYWQPLTWLSLMLDAEAGGIDPFIFHLVNLLLHTLNALLLFLLLERWTGALWRSAGVALLFALHPLTVEAVAWVAERKTVLSACFGLLALAAWTSHVKRPRPTARFAAATLYAASLAAKPMLVTLPFLMLVLDAWPLRRVDRGWRRLALEKTPFFLLAGASVLVSQLSLAGAEALEAGAGRGLGLRIGNAVVSYAGYLGKAAWPRELALFYPYPVAIAGWKVAGAALLVGGVTLGLGAAWRREPALLAGWLWFAGTLVPALGLVQAGFWPAMADRFVYFPIAGLWVAAVWGGAAALRRRPRLRVAVALVACVWVLGLSLRTRAQIAVWRDSVSLLEHAVAVAPDTALLRNNLASSYLEAGRIDEAVIEFERALRLDPRHEKAAVGLARAHTRAGRSEKATRVLNALLARRPDSVAGRIESGNVLLGRGDPEAAARAYREVLRRAPEHAGALYNLAEARRRTGRFREAIELLERAERLPVPDSRGDRLLGDLYAATGQLEEAVPRYERRLRASPGDVALHLALGEVHARLGHLDEAVVHLEEAARLAPQSSEARNNLGNVHLMAGTLELALEAYRRSVELDPTNARAHYNLHLVYSRLGRSDEARRQLAQARRLDPSLPAPLSGTSPHGSSPGVEPSTPH